MKLLQFFLLIIITISLSTGNFAQELPLVDQIAINVKNKNRVFTFTNKSFSQYHGETNKYTGDGWHGWICKEQKLFMDYRILINEKPIDRTTAETFVYPHMLRRNYPGGITEELFLPDRSDEVVLHVKGIKEFNLEFVNFNGQIFAARDSGVFFSLEKVLSQHFLALTANARVKWFKTINDKGITGIQSDSDDIWVLMHVARNLEMPARTDKYSKDGLQNKKDRIEKLLQNCRIITKDQDFDKAYMWAVASLDALVTKQDVKGIFAGLPWFNNNWGRDTFISLPGACLVNGQYDDAREILAAFAEFQNTDTASTYYGRIPNRVTLQDIIYNTTDGTPWFVLQAYEYWKYTGDYGFLKSLLPVVKRAYDGAVKNYVDKSGFLTHGDAETWMDAVGADGPWSPRGNRAVDIQYLWFRQCKITAEIAAICGDKKLAALALKSAAKVKKNFGPQFIDTKNVLIADRITSAGKKDFSFRPNAFYALADTELIPSNDLRAKLFKKLFEKTVTSYGVLSLSNSDKNFHPFHEYAPYYPKDAAYHNGIIWQWNSGPVVDILCDADLVYNAWKLTSELTRQILNEWAVGTIAELMEAMPRGNETSIRMSGAFSQAWSLGEYIRTIRSKYLGIEPVSSTLLKIQPALPGPLVSVEFPVFFKSSKLKCIFQGIDDGLICTIKPLSIKDTFDIELIMPDGPVGSYQRTLKIFPGMAEKIQLDFGYKPTTKIPSPRRSLFTPSLRDDLHFCEVRPDKNLAALKAPEYTMLSRDDVKKNPGPALNIINAATGQNDELYKYPTNPNFTKGILDLTKFVIQSDTENYYFDLQFSDLSDPKWHPEYGYQLTIAGIYFHLSDSGAIDAGRNSHFVFQNDRPWQIAVFVGGGLEVVDGSGKLIARYAPKPADIVNPLGNTALKKISFSLPKSILGKISMKTRISVLIGAQDDHGGSGIGEFRQVFEKESEWYGGGKRTPSAHNIYDFLFIN